MRLPFVALKIEAYEAERALIRQVEAGRVQADRGAEGGRGHKKETPSGNVAGRGSDRHANESRAKAAAMVGVSPRLIQDAR